MSDASLRRTVHFVPGDALHLLEKALRFECDAIVIDLEDAVAADQKAAARQRLGAWLATCNTSKEIFVRINDVRTVWWQDDIAQTLVGSLPNGYMVPKVQSAGDLVQIAAFLDTLEKDSGRRTLFPVATEVPLGVLNLREIAAAPRVTAVTWGCEDLSAVIGATAQRTSEGYTDLFKAIRIATLLAAKAANVHAIDGVFTMIGDLEGLRRETREASEMGFDGKLTIHPRQIEVIHDALAPTAAEVEEARALLEEAERVRKGTFKFRGRMVDAPHLAQARRMLARKAKKTKASPRNSPACGKWFEQFVEGAVIFHALRRTVTETDNVLFTTGTMNLAALHLDYEAAKDTQFRRPLVNSMYTLALVVGISVLESTHGTAVANLGFKSVSFPAPVFFGDTLRVETIVIKTRRSKKNSSQGIVELEHRAFNQREQLVCKAHRVALVACKPSRL